jgi:hypothetical protein
MGGVALWRLTPCGGSAPAWMVSRGPHPPPALPRGRRPGSAPNVVAARARGCRFADSPRRGARGTRHRPRTDEEGSPELRARPSRPQDRAIDSSRMNPCQPAQGGHAEQRREGPREPATGRRVLSGAARQQAAGDQRQSEKPDGRPRPASVWGDEGREKSSRVEAGALEEIEQRPCPPGRVLEPPDWPCRDRHGTAEADREKGRGGRCVTKSLAGMAVRC